MPSDSKPSHRNPSDRNPSDPSAPHVSAPDASASHASPPGGSPPPPGDSPSAPGTSPSAAAAGPLPAAAPGYRALLREREFAGLLAGLILSVAASTLSGLALATLVDARTGSPFLTAVSLYGATFAAVLGALTLMSVADGGRPRRTLIALQCLTLAGVAAQALPGLPLAARFGLLLLLGFFQSLGTGTRMGLLAEVVPRAGYATARSLTNIIAGATAVLGYAVGGALIAHLTPYQLFCLAAALTAAGLAVVATTVREYSVRRADRPAARPGDRAGLATTVREHPVRAGLRRTWATNRELLGDPRRRVLLLNLWVPNGLIVGCEALFLPYAPEHAGSLLAAASAGMLLGDLVVGRLLTAEGRRRAAYPLRLLLAAPCLLFVLHPPLPAALVAVFLSGTGFAATLPLQELLLAATPRAVRGQVQGVESAGRMTWQGLGAAAAGGVAGLLTPAAAITAVAAASIAVTVVSRPRVARAARAVDAGGSAGRARGTSGPRGGAPGSSRPIA